MFKKDKIWKNIEADLFPKVIPSKVIGKIFSLHLLSILIVLSFCSQFGLSLFGFLGLSPLIDISHYFMKISHSFCQIACGLTLFLTSSSLIYTQLKMTEKEWLMSQKYLVFSLLIALTGGLFIMVAPDITVLNVALWAMGAYFSLLANHLFIKISLKA